MTWFKIDDGFDGHRKTRKLGKPQERLIAVGLWTLAGVWAGRNLTDGFVPDEEVERYDPDGFVASQLVEAGLWERVEVDGEPGYQFHDWGDQQPSRQDVLKKRQDTKERVAKHRAKKKAEALGLPPEPDVEPEGVDDPTPTLPGLDTPTRNSVSNGTPVPSRPDPTRPEEEKSSPSQGGAGDAGKPATTKAAKGTRLPEDWAPSEADKVWFREKCPTLASQPGKGTELLEEFRNYWLSLPGSKGVRTQWWRVWRNRMTELEGRAAAQAARGGLRAVGSGPAAQRPATSDQRAAQALSYITPDGDDEDPPPTALGAIAR